VNEINNVPYYGEPSGIISSISGLKILEHRNTLSVLLPQRKPKSQETGCRKHQLYNINPKR
jgi:hypothetical protein